MAITPEGAAMTAFVNNVMGKLFNLLGVVEETYTMLRDLKQESESLKMDLDMLAASVDDELIVSRGASRTAIARVYSNVMRGLMHDIEDCIERFAHRVTCKTEKWWFKTMWLRFKFAAEIKKLKKQVQEARTRVLEGAGHPASSRSNPGRPTASDEAPPHLPTPVGIEQAMAELLVLLDLDFDQSQVQQLSTRVISIVGFGGVGKTTLAGAVYHNSDVARAIACRAWVNVHSLEPKDAAMGILKKIQQQLLPENSKASLSEHLKNQRCLIVIDDINDINDEQWAAITSVLHANRTGSRIVVTTTMRSTANKRSGNQRYVYQMRTLKKSDSMKVALGEGPSPELELGSATLLKKCDGLPLALVSVATQLRSENDPTGASCAQLCSRLGSILGQEDGEHNFARLREVLVDNYSGLYNLTVRTCLLYLCIFPAEGPLRKNVIVRRWLAEGYARSDDITRTEQSIANEVLNAFLDRHIIQTVETKTIQAVGTRQTQPLKTHGIMHEFLLHKSICEKFVMSFRAPRDKLVRHLFVHGDVSNDTSSRTTFNVDLSRVRSLTVRGSSDGAISDLGKYKLMRVLDLEECTDVNDSHLSKICKMWNLRYLSLGPNVTKLPKKIAQLEHLGTLATSQTAVSVLPVEVIGMPNLTHLIGKLKLAEQNRTSDGEQEQQLRKKELQELSTKSKLENVSGFLADGRPGQGFLQLMVHMKNLRKVKIWCQPTEDVEDINNLNNDLIKALQQYMKAPIGDGNVRSMSIDFQALPPGSLRALRDLYHHSQSLKETYYLSSLKLHGDLSSSAEFVVMVSGLTKLCLASTTVSQDLLSALSEMRFLVSLKVTADETDGFVIRDGAFQSLRHLHFVVRRRSPVRPEIGEGALPQLASLQLLCKHLDGTCAMEIRKLTKVQEIKLHSELGVVAKGKWEAEARSHPNKPNVSYLSVDNLSGDEPTPEESAHEDAVIQGQLARERAVSSISNNSGLVGGMDDSTHHQATMILAPDEEAHESGIILEQQIPEEPWAHCIVMPTGQESSFVESVPTDTHDPNSDQSGITGERDGVTNKEPRGKNVASEGSSHETDIQGQAVKVAAPKYSRVHTQQEACTLATSASTSSGRTSAELHSIRTVP